MAVLATGVSAKGVLKNRGGSASIQELSEHRAWLIVPEEAAASIRSYDEENAQ